MTVKKKLSKRIILNIVIAPSRVFPTPDFIWPPVQALQARRRLRNSLLAHWSWSEFLVNMIELLLSSLDLPESSLSLLQPLLP